MLIVIGPEVRPSAGGRRGCKEAGGDHEAVHTLGDAAAGEVEILMAIDGQRGKGLGVALPVEKVEVADRGSGRSRRSFRRGRPAGRMRIRQRVKQDAVDHGKERGIGADAEGEGDKDEAVKRGERARVRRA